LRRPAIALAAVLLSTAAASAGELEVTPVQLYVARGASSTLLTLKNQSTTEPLRLQLTGFAWKQKENGDMDLAPSDDLVLFPQMVTLPPSAERKIRVGTTAAPAAVERTYRIFVEELPPLENAANPEQGVRLNVRTRVGIPVFITPPKAAVEAKIETPAWTKDGRLGVTVQNSGTVHFVARTLDVQGRDAAGTTVFEKPVQGWYVLAGESRAFDIELPKAACARTKSVSVTLTTERGVFTRKFEAPGGACAP
jgi:fimbrial chaperone protein